MILTPRRRPDRAGIGCSPSRLGANCVDPFHELGPVLAEIAGRAETTEGSGRVWETVGKRAPGDGQASLPRRVPLRPIAAWRACEAFSLLQRTLAAETFPPVRHATCANDPVRRLLLPDMTTTLPGTTHRYVQANGLRVHVVEAGTDGPPVLLLHGFPQHAYAWRHVIADLAADHRVYALDLRGAGQTDAPPRGYDTATLAADVLAVLDALGLPVVELVGHQWGGWLGFTLALTAPDRFSAFVAVNAPHPWLPHRRLLPQMWRFWYTALLEYPVLGAWVIRTRPGVLRWLLRRGRPGLPDADIDVFADCAREPARARAGQQLHWQIVLHDIPRRMLGGYRRQHLTVPTLLLAGTGDFALSPRSLTGAPHNAGDHLQVRVVDGGHYLPEERPAQVAAAIRELSNLPSVDERNNPA